MEQSQRTGLMIMIGSAFALVLFLWAVMRRSYAALAIPVAGAFAVVSALAFWIGWTMYTAEDEEAEEESKAEEESA